MTLTMCHGYPHALVVASRPRNGGAQRIEYLCQIDDLLEDGSLTGGSQPPTVINIPTMLSAIPPMAL